VISTRSCFGIEQRHAARLGHRRRSPRDLATDLINHGVDVAPDYYVATATIAMPDICVSTMQEILSSSVLASSRRIRLRCFSIRADMRNATDVAFGREADMTSCSINVCF
jgi:hypothetical protein